MILWEIFRAVTAAHAGIDSGMKTVYNILQEKQRYKEGIIMQEMIEARMEACKNHPERQQIFYLEKMLLEADYPYFFNFWEELRPTPFNHDGGDPEKDIDWDKFNFHIEIGQPAGYGLSELSICFNTKGDPELLELLDMRKAIHKENPTAMDGELYQGLTAEQAMEFIERYFKRA